MTSPRALLRRAGLPDAAPQRLAGGDTSEVWRVGPWVVKTHASPKPGLYEAEARGLAWLADHGVPVPRPRWADAEGLVLPFLPAGPPRPTELGQVIAHMHGIRGPLYGSPHPGFLGDFSLPAAQGTSWRAVVWTRWLEPLLRATAPRLGPLAARVERLAETVPLPEEGPRLQHGDLWSGNVLHTAEGPALIDPSAVWGERALDLAMMRLFGGFGGATQAAYARALPLSEATERAIPFHQLPYLLVHVHFFGAGYVGGVEDVLRHYGE